MANVISEASRWRSSSNCVGTTSGEPSPSKTRDAPRGEQASGWFAKTEAQAFEKLLAPWPGAEILEVGGGHGYLAGYLARQGFHLTVVSNMPDSDADASRQLSEASCCFMPGSLRRIPFPDRSFPVVISTSLVSHRGHWEAFVDELTRVADQAVVFSFPKRRSLNTLYAWMLPIRHGRGIHIAPTSFVLDEQVVIETLAELGFHPTGRHANVLFPSSLHQGLDIPPFSLMIEAVPYVLGLIDAFGSPVFLRAERASAA